MGYRGNDVMLWPRAWAKDVIGLDGLTLGIELLSD